MDDSFPIITGLGTLTALGADLDSTLQGFRAADRSDRVVDPDPSYGPWSSFRAHPVRGLDPSVHLSRADRAYLAEFGLAEDRDLLLLLCALRMALEDSCPPGLGDRRVGLIISQENPGVTHLISGLMSSLLTGKPPGDSDSEYARTLFRRHQAAFYHVQAFPHLFHVARIFGIKGPTLYVNNACASGLYALEAASQMIMTDQADLVLVGVSDHGAHPVKHLWFEEMGLIASDLTRPFDRDRSGFLLGDGGAALVLERREQALSRDACCYAAYRGGSFVQEGWQISLPNVVDRPYRHCITQAMERAGVSPGEIDLVVAHGTGTAVGDRLCLTEAFGGPSRTPTVTAFKPVLGHTLGASALLETALLAAAMARGEVLPAWFCERTDPAIPLHLQRQPSHSPTRLALKVVNAFAGFDAAVILGEVRA